VVDICNISRILAIFYIGLYTSTPTLNNLELWWDKLIIGANPTKWLIEFWIYSFDANALNIIIVPCEWPMYFTLSTFVKFLIYWILANKSLSDMSLNVKSQYWSYNLSLNIYESLLECNYSWSKLYVLPLAFGVNTT